MNKNNIKSIDYLAIMPVWKLALYCIFTFNLYQFYWFYKSWKFIEYHKQKNFNPLIRTLATFLPVLILILPFILFKEIYSIINPQEKTKSVITAIILTFLFAGINSFMYEESIYKWVAYLTFLPLLIVQHHLNNYNQKGFYNG